MLIEYYVYVSWLSSMCFFFNDTATTEIYTLSLHDALPIYLGLAQHHGIEPAGHAEGMARHMAVFQQIGRSEEHTSELQSRLHLVCRLLLEKKKRCFGVFIHLSTSTRSLESVDFDCLTNILI